MGTFKDILHTGTYFLYSRGKMHYIIFFGNEFRRYMIYWDIYVVVEKEALT